MGRKSSMSKLTSTKSHFTRHRCSRHRLHHHCRYCHHQHHQHHYYYHCHYHYRNRFHNCFFYYHRTGICRKCRESFESKSQIDELTLAIKDLKMVSNLIDRFNRIAPPFFNAITLSEEVNKVKLKFLFVVVSNVGGPN